MGRGEKEDIASYEIRLRFCRRLGGCGKKQINKIFNYTKGICGTKGTLEVIQVTIEGHY